MSLREAFSVGVIGCGNMGSALVRGMVRRRVVKPSRLLVHDPDRAKVLGLARAHRVRIGRSDAEVAARSDILILAVKPQEMAEALRQMRPRLGHRPLVISIAAGIPTRWIERRVGGSVPVVRVMPNTAALVERGIAAVAGGRSAGSRHLRLTERIFGAVGEVVRVPERWMDAVTAVSGSGPAYFFYLMEQMIEAGRALGLSGRVAKKLAISTAAGAAALAAQGEEPARLRARVTSRGGTTEAAFRVFQRRGLGRTLQAGIRAAARRAKTLSGRK